MAFQVMQRIYRNICKGTNGRVRSINLPPYIYKTLFNTEKDINQLQYIVLVDKTTNKLIVVLSSIDGYMDTMETINRGD
jgi:hypothetical protein